MNLFLAIALLNLGSPNQQFQVELHNEAENMTMQVMHGQDTIVPQVALGLTLTDGTQVASAQDRVVKQRKRSIHESVDAPFYRQSHIDADANELSLQFQSGFELQVRAYNEGVAYRFVANRKKGFEVQAEKLECCFNASDTTWLSYSTNDKQPYAMAFQNRYDVQPLSQLADKPAFLPATVQSGDYKVTLLESNVRHYPNMFVRSDKTDKLVAEFPAYPSQMEYYPWRHMNYVSARENYIARCDGRTAMPWRILSLTDDDCQMPVNNLVYLLSDPNCIGATDWIQPGKVAWDWWNDWNLTGVNFRTGINMPTYRYYIDFAAAHGIEYVVLDEGWYDPKAGDMLKVIPALNLDSLIDYANQRKVKLVLWCVFNVLDDQLDEACRLYSSKGIAGFKVDFLDRNDQTAVEMAYRIADRCAQYHLMLDYHGFYTPTGMNRTYPNVVNYESVFGMEEMKWSPKEVDMPQYDVTFPFIRLQAGQVDYTPGAMRNASRSDWCAAYSTPMSQGTRCHQLATYIVYDSPFTMLCDAPTMYEKEEEYTHFVASLPTVFDSTFIAAGKMGEYIVTVRRKGNSWYIAGLTNWQARDISIPLSFLPKQAPNAILYEDGVNADRNAQDYVRRTLMLSPSDKLKVHLAPGGGFAIEVKE